MSAKSDNCGGVKSGCVSRFAPEHFMVFSRFNKAAGQNRHCESEKNEQFFPVFQDGSRNLQIPSGVRLRACDQKVVHLPPKFHNQNSLNVCCMACGIIFCMTGATDNRAEYYTVKKYGLRPCKMFFWPCKWYFEFFWDKKEQFVDFFLQWPPVHLLSSFSLSIMEGEEEKKEVHIRYCSKNHNRTKKATLRVQGALPGIEIVCLSSQSWGGKAAFAKYCSKIHNCMKKVLFFYREHCQG